MLYKSLLKTVPSPPNLSKVDFKITIKNNLITLERTKMYPMPITDTQASPEVTVSRGKNEDELQETDDKDQ